MLDIWLPLLAIAAIAWGWYHVLRLRERATARARQLCESHGLQLLDDSVALRRLRIVRRHRTWCALREYRFEVSLGGHDRRTATLSLLGDRLVGANLPEDPRKASTAPGVTAMTFRVAAPPYVARPGTDDNVIPITRARHTLH